MSVCLASATQDSTLSRAIQEGQDTVTCHFLSLLQPRLLCRCLFLAHTLLRCGVCVSVYVRARSCTSCGDERQTNARQGSSKAAGFSRTVSDTDTVSGVSLCCVASGFPALRAPVGPCPRRSTDGQVCSVFLLHDVQLPSSGPLLILTRGHVRGGS